MAYFTQALHKMGSFSFDSTKPALQEATVQIPVYHDSSLMLILLSILQCNMGSGSVRKAQPLPPACKQIGSALAPFHFPPQGPCWVPTSAAGLEGAAFPGAGLHAPAQAEATPLFTDVTPRPWFFLTQPPTQLWSSWMWNWRNWLENNPCL